MPAKLQTRHAAALAAALIAGSLIVPTGASFASGKNEVLKVILQPVSSAVGSYPISFLDQPVQREISDATGEVLETAYANGTVIVNPVPALRIFRAGADLTLVWPESAAGLLRAGRAGVGLRGHEAKLLREHGTAERRVDAQ